MSSVSGQAGAAASAAAFAFDPSTMREMTPIPPQLSPPQLSPPPPPPPRPPSSNALTPVLTASLLIGPDGEDQCCALMSLEAMERMEALTTQLELSPPLRPAAAPQPPAAPSRAPRATASASDAAPSAAFRSPLRRAAARRHACSSWDLFGIGREGGGGGADKGAGL